MDVFPPKPISVFCRFSLSSLNESCGLSSPCSLVLFILFIMPQCQTSLARFNSYSSILILVAPIQPLYTGFIQLGAGLSVGLAGLAAGFAIGIVGDAGVRGTAQQPKLFVGMILILIFAEVLGKDDMLPIFEIISSNINS